MRSLWKENLREKQTKMLGYNILKELVAYHDCLKRKGQKVGRKKDYRRVKEKMQWHRNEGERKEKIT